MKPYLQNTNSADKRHIKQAIRLRNQADARKKGWKRLGNGVFKVVFKKGKIVVKFPRDRRDSYHLTDEIEKYFSIPKYYRRYFARVFGGDENKIIQRYVPIDNDYIYSWKEEKRCYDIIYKFDLDDVDPGHNMTIVNKKPIIYDFGF